MHSSFLSYNFYKCKDIKRNPAPELEGACLAFAPQEAGGPVGFPPDAGRGDAVGAAMGGAGGGRAWEGKGRRHNAASAVQVGSPRGAHGCPRRGRGSCYPSSPGGEVGRGTGGKGENPPPLPHGNRVALKAAKRRSLETGTGADGGFPSLAPGREGARAGRQGAVGARVRDIGSKSPSFWLPWLAPRLRAAFQSCWMRGEPSEDSAPQRGERRCASGGLGDRAGFVTHRCCFSGEGVFLATLHGNYKSTFIATAAGRACGFGDAKWSGQHVALGMQSTVMLRYLGCWTSPRGLCRGLRAAEVHIPAEQWRVCSAGCASLPQPAGVLGTRGQVRGQGAMCCCARSGAEPP